MKLLLIVKRLNILNVSCEFYKIKVDNNDKDEAFDVKVVILNEFIAITMKTLKINKII